MPRGARALSSFVLRLSKDGRRLGAAEGSWFECLTTNGTRPVSDGTGLWVMRMEG